MMRRALILYAALMAGLFQAVPVHAAQSVTTARAEHVALDAALQAAAKPGATDWVAFHFAIAPGWHLYWTNPGETGLPTEVKWTLPRGVSAGDTRWPVPERFTTGNIVNYGFERAVTLLVPLKTTAPPGAAVAKADLSWLLCAQMCIPQSATMSFPLIAPFGDAARFAPALAALPKGFHGTARVTTAAHTITLTLSGAALQGADPDAIRFFPATRRAVDDATLPEIFRSGDTLTVTFAQHKHWRTFKAFDGVLDLAAAGAYNVTAARVAAAAPAAMANPAPAAAAIGFWPAALFAILGGLILNLMPCVLPILSMKALALVQSGEGVRALRRDGLFYFAGVLVSFVAMAAALIAVKAAGTEIGWGFQLQSPIVIAGLTLLTGAIGLNLLGLFEVPLSIAGVGSRLTEGASRASAFFTGVLAALVASPCTAPFMGAAMGYALTQPAATTLAIFAALGIGFAAPFTALTFAPGIVRLIPKPGAWMVRFKEFLAFPMFATGIWLLWVLDLEAGATGLAMTLVSGLALVFLFWLFRHLSPRWRLALDGMGAAIIAALLGFGLSAPAPAPAARMGEAWAPWSAQAVDAARHAGRPVLVDFGAAWCVTCLVNEHVAFDNADVERRLAETHVVTLKGDWTNRDPEISALLARYGRAGVPLYLLYPVDPSARAIVLPQILSPAIVLEAVAHLEDGSVPAQSRT